ncbi:unnamed protein product, partial [Sphacelaria rigidula]
MSDAPRSRCVSKGQGHSCVYLRRKPNSGRPRLPRPDACPVSTDPDTYASILRAGTTATAGDVASTRCRLSASPATGLIGTQENAFLADYFSCVGFLPLTCGR